MSLNDFLRLQRQQRENQETGQRNLQGGDRQRRVISRNRTVRMLGPDHVTGEEVIEVIRGENGIETERRVVTDFLMCGHLRTSGNSVRCSCGSIVCRDCVTTCSNCNSTICSLCMSLAGKNGQPLCSRCARNRVIAALCVVGLFFAFLSFTFSVV